jgi:APA family basic amino acid/polyamine antiporter
LSDPEPTASQPGKLLSVLGVAFGLAGSVGGTIGAGILRTPGLVAAQLHTPWLVLLAWLIGGVYALLGAICIAELAASLPRAGGWYVYAKQAFGRRAGWLVGWTDWLAHCIGLAWVATTVGELLAGWIPAEWAANWQGQTLALVMLSLFSAIQLLGVRAGGASQELLSLVKAVAFLGLALASFVLPTPAAELGANDPALLVPQSPALAVGAVLALQAVITTFDGWASPVYFAEEFTEPSHDLPRSLIGGVLAVLALYLLINGALLHVLPLPVLSQANLPAADAARSLMGARGGQAIAAVALVSLLGLINTVVMAAPRILYGLSRDRLMPAFLSRVNPGGTPTVAVLLTSSCAGLLVLTGSFDALLGMGAVLYVGLPLSGIAAQLWLRQQQPDLPRPFLSWGYPVTPWLVGCGSIAFLLGAVANDTANSLWALGLVGAGALGVEAWQRFGSDGLEA